jgi:ATP-dependent Clp protease ATP-binding subunit ClpC
MRLEVTDQAKDWLAKMGFDKMYGARPLRRAIQRYIEDPLSEELLKVKFGAGDAIRIEVADDELKLTPIHTQPPKPATAGKAPKSDS